MTLALNASSPLAERIEALILAAERGDITAAEMTELDRLVREEPQARRFYAQYVIETVDLHSWAACVDCQEIPFSFDSLQDPHPVPFSFLGSAAQGAIGYFTQTGPLSYLIATFIMLLLGVAAWSWKLPVPVQVANQFLPSPSTLVPRPSDKMQFVGRITGMVDCQWSDPTTAVPGPVAVPLGRKYVLASGLMEITYDAGAKVILQGPCTYEVESPAGGFLSVGKLTAKLEKKPNSPRPSDGRGAGGEGGESSIHPSSSILHPLFFVRTPTAVVTDLGTEFGVEVDNNGATQSHVFRGSVRLQVASDDEKTESDSRVLHENDSGRVENSRDQGGPKRIEMLNTSTPQPDFVREIPRRKAKTAIKTFDLVDVVAGGDGFSGKRNAGIDPTNGQTSDKPPKKFHLSGDGTYHRVVTLPCIDGVFIPNGKKSPVQIDSAGHTFADCPATDNITYGYIWAGGVIPAVDPKRSQPTVMGGVDYGSSGHGALSMHANKGITFDLDAIRRANSDHEPVRFVAVIGNTEPFSSRDVKQSCFADVWVLVDGNVRFRRREISGCNGSYTIELPIGKNDRFLTLVATDGGNTFKYDWLLLGDPRLELAPSESASKHDSAQTGQAFMTNSRKEPQAFAVSPASITEAGP